LKVEASLPERGVRENILMATKVQTAKLQRLNTKQSLEKLKHH